MSDERVQIEVLYFAAIRERMGRERESLELPLAAPTIADLSAWIEAHRPALRGLLSRVRFAVGDQFADSGRVLVRGDVVALIPPVSGG